jgi:hypothetical protein
VVSIRRCGSDRHGQEAASYGALTVTGRQIRKTAIGKRQARLVLRGKCNHGFDCIARKHHVQSQNDAKCRSIAIGPLMTTPQK